jgi:diacylglycerol O-acyltransferase / wax synthase
MARMTAMEAAFLAIERENEPRHIGVLMILDPSRDGPLTHADVLALVQERLPRMPTERRVVTNASLGLSRPSWRYVSEVDLDAHVLRVALGPSGSREELAGVVSALHSTRLPRDRPLWQLVVIEGLPDDRVGLYAKVHLAALDDTTGIDLLTALLDEPGRAAIEASMLSDGDESAPDLYDRLVDPLPDQLRRAAGFPVRLARRATRSIGEQLPGWQVTAAEVAARTPGMGPFAPFFSMAADTRVGHEHPTGRAPRLSFNAPISRARSYAFDELPTADVMRLKTTAHCSFNEVVLAACAGGLRRWLLAHDELPSSPVVAIVPVLVGGSVNGRKGQHVAGIVMSLPTHIAEPRLRLQRTIDALATAKKRRMSVPASLQQDVAMFAPPFLAAWATGVLDALPHRPFVSPTVNLAITNVPGPRRPVCVAGRPLHSTHPVLSVTDLTPLHLGVQPGPERVGLGAIACRDHIDDPFDLLRDITLELAELEAAVTPSRERASTTSA